MTDWLTASEAFHSNLRPDGKKKNRKECCYSHLFFRNWTRSELTTSPFSLLEIGLIVVHSSMHIFPFSILNLTVYLVPFQHLFIQVLDYYWHNILHDKCCHSNLGYFSVYSFKQDGNVKVCRNQSKVIKYHHNKGYNQRSSICHMYMNKYVCGKDLLQGKCLIFLFYTPL